MKEIIQLKISLDESNPSIWRRVYVHKSTTFFELHHIIQIAMGWKNYHMFEFSIEGYRIGMVDDRFNLEGFGSDSVLECRETKLEDILSEEGEAFAYEYDMGDSWMHAIMVESFSDVDMSLIYPICIEGQMACPPEDCQGINGFYHYLDILQNKRHPEYLETKQWMPRGYNPMRFNCEKTNMQLGKIDKYIAKWLKDWEG